MRAFANARMRSLALCNRRRIGWQCLYIVQSKARLMKIRNSLKSLKDRHRDNRVIRRRGRTYVINKTNRRFKARQG